MRGDSKRKQAFGRSSVSECFSEEATLSPKPGLRVPFLCWSGRSFLRPLAKSQAYGPLRSTLGLGLRARRSPQVQSGPSVLTCPSLVCGSARCLRVPAAAAASGCGVPGLRLTQPRAAEAFCARARLPSPPLKRPSALPSAPNSLQCKSFLFLPHNTLRKNSKSGPTAGNFRPSRGLRGQIIQRKKRGAGRGFSAVLRAPPLGPGSGFAACWAWIRICRLLSRKPFAAQRGVRLSRWRLLLFLLCTLPD